MRICNNKRNPFCRMMLTIYVIVRPVLALVLNKRGTIDTKLTMQSSGEEPSSRGFPMHAKNKLYWSCGTQIYRNSDACKIFYFFVGLLLHCIKGSFALLFILKYFLLSSAVVLKCACDVWNLSHRLRLKFQPTRKIWFK